MFVSYVFVLYKDDEESIKNMLMKILLDEKLRDRLQKNCRHEIIQYEWNTITDEIERIYNSVLI